MQHLSLILVGDPLHGRLKLLLDHQDVKSTILLLLQLAASGGGEVLIARAIILLDQYMVLTRLPIFQLLPILLSDGLHIRQMAHSMYNHSLKYN